MMQEGRATKGGYREAPHRREGDKGAAAQGVYKEGEGKVVGRAVFGLSLVVVDR